METQSQATGTAGARPVLAAIDGMPASDGAGVRMTRMIGQPRLQMLDPFLMLDHFNSDQADDYIAGFPDHPHRGFETVTYMLNGRLRHEDNRGNAGVLEAGGVQWMRAGRGIVHSEMPEQEDGLMRGFQIWLNLPRALKMTAPDYRDIPDTAMPVESRDGATVKVIAGTTSKGTRGPTPNEPTQANIFDVRLPANARFSETVPADHNVALIVFDGALADRVAAPKVLVLGQGERVDVQAGSEGAGFLLLSGRPLGEPVAWGGPFVMNSREEVMQAFDDFQNGRF